MDPNKTDGTSAPGQQADPATVTNAQGSATADLRQEGGAEVTETGLKSNEFLNRLGIPKELHAQIQGGRKSGEAAHVPGDKASNDQDGSGNLPGDVKAEEPLTSQGEEAQQKDADDGPTHEDDAEEQEQEQEQEGQQLTAEQRTIQKLQRRIDKLTAKRNVDREEVADLREQMAVLQEQTGRKPNAQQQRDQKTAPDPKDPGALAHIQSEPELNEFLGGVRVLREWCKANKDGVQAGERFYSPEEIGSWADTAGEHILNAPERRLELRDEAGNQQKWVGARKEADDEARERFPALFDEKNQDYADACELLQAEPWLRNRPDVHLLLGVWLEGKKALAAKGINLTSNGSRSASADSGVTSVTRANGLSHQRSSNSEFIPERLRKPQPPLAPSTPGRPMGSGVPSPARKKVAQAMSDLANDPDGGASKLAAVFAAQDAGR